MDRPPVEEEYMKEIEEARRELRALIYEKKCAADMLRLAWDDACTYDPNSQIVGGPNGSVKAEPSGKEELKSAIVDCGRIKEKLIKISDADIYQLAGVVAVEVTGGPTIDFVPGREDSGEATPGGRLPDLKLKSASRLRDILSTRMGLSDQDIVALWRAHNLAYEVHAECKEEKCKRDLSKFDNSYFVELLKRNKSLFSVASNMALVKDRKFRKYVEKYAQDEEAFFKDYAAAHKKLSELGWNLNVVPKKPMLKKPKGGVIRIIIVSAMLVAKIYFRKRGNNLLKKK